MSATTAPPPPKNKISVGDKPTVPKSYTVSQTFYKHIFRTSAVSSTNFTSLLIFSSCLLVLVINDVGNFSLDGRGPILLL